MIGPEHLKFAVSTGAIIGLFSVMSASMLVVVWDFNRRWARDAPIYRAIPVYCRKIIPKYNWKMLFLTMIKAVCGGAIGGALLLALLIGGEAIIAYHL